MGTPLTLGASAVRLDTLSLGAGIDELAARSFPAGRVSALGVEHAIEWVEEAIMAAGPLPGAGGALDLGDASLDAVFGLVAPGASQWSLDAVERAFRELVDHASGSAVAARELPTDAATAARLVWLRELMHHGPYRAVNRLR